MRFFYTIDTQFSSPWDFAASSSWIKTLGRSITRDAPVMFRCFVGPGYVSSWMILVKGLMTIIFDEYLR